MVRLGGERLISIGECNIHITYRITSLEIPHIRNYYLTPVFQ